MLKVKLFTIFPELIPGFLGYSLTGKALNEGLWSIETVNIRDYAKDKYGSVDDTPCGGGAGMVMRADILSEAIKANHKTGRIISMSPRGIPLTQSKVHELSKEENLSIICSRFEGIDERVLEAYNVEEISIGDYILTGGEQVSAEVRHEVEHDEGNDERDARGGELRGLVQAGKTRGNECDQRQSGEHDDAQHGAHEAHD